MPGSTIPGYTATGFLPARDHDLAPDLGDFGETISFSLVEHSGYPTCWVNAALSLGFE
jgi:hypothetical protein